MARLALACLLGSLLISSACSSGGAVSTLPGAIASQDGAADGSMADDAGSDSASTDAASAGDSTGPGDVATEEDTAAPGDTSDADDAAPACPTPSFKLDASPVLKQYCGKCHSGWTDSCTSAKKQMKSILLNVNGGYMPPKGQPQLSAQDKAVLKAWSSGGMVCGTATCP